MRMSAEETRRSDLEAIQSNRADDLIGGIIMPRFAVMEMTGDAYFQELISISAPGAAVAEGAAPAGTKIGSNHKTFTCSRILERYWIPEGQVQQKGGIDVCDQQGAEAAMLSVQYAREKRVAAAVLTNGTATAVAEGGFIAQIKTAKKGLRGYAGKTVLVLSETAYDVVIEMTDVQKRIKNFQSIQPADNEQVLALDKKLLAMVLKVDDVLIGNDEYWAYTITSGSVDLSQRAALLKISPDIESIENMKPVFAKTAVYKPNDNDFSISAFYNADTHTYNYDAEQYVSEIVFNSAACKVFSGIGAVVVTPPSGDGV